MSFCNLIHVKGIVYNEKIKNMDRLTKIVASVPFVTADILQHTWADFNY